jgi:uncharacterized RDD family membrane protein YckC
MPRTVGALAAVSRPMPRVQSPDAPAPSPRGVANLARAVQRPLPFGDQGAWKVVAFESYAPPPAASKPPSRTATRRKPRVSPDQGSLEFMPAAPPKPRTLGTSVEAVICCDAPVCTPAHRGLAALLDGSMVLIGYGLFLLAFYLAGGEFAVNKLGLGIFGGMLVLISCFYRLYWAIASTESAGMRWMHLRLITFEGFPPDRKQLLLRFAISCLCLGVGGQLWSLLDEENLAWPDHASGTFPTPWEMESRIFRRH